MKEAESSTLDVTMNPNNLWWKIRKFSTDLIHQNIHILLNQTESEEEKNKSVKALSIEHWIFVPKTKSQPNQIQRIQ